MKRTTDRILTAVFCDDIRHEIGNKMSFMGVYQGELIVPSTPIALPRLCIFATALTPIERPFKSLTLRVLLNDETELARLEVPHETFADLPDIQDNSATRKQVSTALSFSPFFIEKQTTLRLMADTDEGEIVGPRLLIKTGPIGLDVASENALPNLDGSSTKEKRSRKSSTSQ
jgi:hypothetical protein